MRPSGSYERYSLSRALIGFPPVLVFVAHLKFALTGDDLASAVNELLQLYPLLGCCIPEASKPQPYWSTNAAALSAADIVDVVHASAPSVSDLLAQNITQARKSARRARRTAVAHNALCCRLQCASFARPDDSPRIVRRRRLAESSQRAAASSRSAVTYSCQARRRARSRPTDARGNRRRSAVLDAPGARRARRAALPASARMAPSSAATGLAEPAPR